MNRDGMVKDWRMSEWETKGLAKAADSQSCCFPTHLTLLLSFLLTHLLSNYAFAALPLYTSIACHTMPVRQLDCRYRNQQDER